MGGSRPLLALAALAALGPLPARTALAQPPEAAGCAGDGPVDGCAVEGGLALDSAEDSSALHLLQKRGLQKSGLEESQAQEQLPELPTLAPNNTWHIDMNSSHHGNGSIWRHWNKLLRKCTYTHRVITRGCRREMVAVTTAVFNLLKRKEGQNYTHDEIKEFRHRFTNALKANVTIMLTVRSITNQYHDWKQAIFQIYELMRPIVTRALVDEVNHEGLGWEAHYRSDLAGKSTIEAVGMTGLELSDEEAAAMLQETRAAEAEDLLEIAKAPEAWGPFDTRERWPECRSITGHVRFQDCQNCWSHATALITESRVCIATRGRLQGRDAWLSQSFIAMCRGDGRDYCAGASGALGFTTVNQMGVPTGAPNSKGNADPGIRTCVPQIEPNLQGVRCPSSCRMYSYPRSLERDLFYPKFSPRSLSPRGAQTAYLVKRSMLEEGPVLFGMSVFADFWSYHSGVYNPSRSSNNRNMGGHAVTGMGFGPGYYLCINSWGPSFGENGAFKVAPAAVNLVVVLPGRVYDSWYPMPVP